MNDDKFTNYQAWLDCVNERGLIPAQVQGHNNFECVKDGALVAFWNGHVSEGMVVAADEPPVVTEEQGNADG